MSKIVRLIDHIRHRTLLHRICAGWQDQRRRKRISRWDGRTGKMEYLEARIEHGIRMRLHFDSELARLIYCDDFERTERLFLDTFLKRGDIFVDVGANIGLFSLIAARRVGSSGKVYAFEPAQISYQRLKENVALNAFRNVQCFQSALSDESGEFPFYNLEDGFDAWNSFVHPDAGKSFTKAFTQCVKWDQFARHHHLVGKVAMMKIDVEGWEIRVLRGGYETFSRDDAPLLQVEFTEEAAASAGSSCRELYHTLEALGYTMFTYHHQRRELHHDPLRKHYPYVNLIAAKKVPDLSFRSKKENF